MFKICPIVLHTGLLVWGHFHAPKHDMTKNKWHIGGPWPIQSGHGSQTFYCQSECLATVRFKYGYFYYTNASIHFRRP